MKEENTVLCGSNYYEQKYYFNDAVFATLPQAIREELKIMCVLFTEDVGGVLILEYAPDGSLLFRVESDESDLLYDDIGSALKLKQLQTDKQELLSALELYYRVMIKGEKFDAVGD